MPIRRFSKGGGFGFSGTLHENESEERKEHLKYLSRHKENVSPLRKTVTAAGENPWFTLSRLNAREDGKTSTSLHDVCLVKKGIKVPVIHYSLITVNPRRITSFYTILVRLFSFM